MTRAPVHRSSRAPGVRAGRVSVAAEQEELPAGGLIKCAITLG